MSIVTKLPDVAKVEGFILNKRATLQESSVTLQYSDHNNVWYEMEIPLDGALYLLHLLLIMSAEQDYEPLSQPPPESD